MICLCGKYLSSNVTPSDYLYLLISGEDIKRILSSFAESKLFVSATFKSLNYKRAVIQQRSMLYNASVQMFSCPDCGRLHVFWQRNYPATSYQMRLEKPFDEASDKIGAANYRLLADLHYDRVMDALLNTDAMELDVPAFREQFLQLSKQMWFRNGSRQGVVEWETGWISEYLYEYGEVPPH
jgi:hypothetical protein